MSVRAQNRNCLILSLETIAYRTVAEHAVCQSFAMKLVIHFRSAIFDAGCQEDGFRSGPFPFEQNLKAGL